MNIHDNSFKHNFTKRNVAQDFLRHNLPKEVLDAVDLATLEVLPNEFLPSKYVGRRHADTLYEVKAKGSKEAYLLVHLEAQSKKDKKMALRVWEYHTAILRQHIKRNKDKAVLPKLPLILSFVLYNGKAAWEGPESVADLFSDFKSYVELAAKSTFLINLKDTPMEKLKCQEAAAVPQMIMKGRVLGDYCNFLQELCALMKKYDQFDDQNIDYMSVTDRHKEMQFLEKLSIIAPEETAKYKDMFERAYQEGIKIGEQIGEKRAYQKGIEIGEQRGEEKKLEQAVRRMHEEGIDLKMIIRVLEITEQKATDIIKNT